MNIKPYISGELRKSGLLDLFDRLRFNVQRLRYMSANKKFKAANPGIAIPPDYFIYETYYRLNIEEYYNDGLASAKELIDLIAKYRDIKAPDFYLLDWGSGTGRITRHFPALLLKDAEVFGTDYNQQYIDWCTHNLGGIYWFRNEIDPPLPYGTGFMDAVTGLSVFTHLSGKNHAPWMNELHRIMKDAGILIISTQGAAFRNKLLPEEKRNFDNGLLVTRESSLEGHRLFSSFQPETYMRALVKDKFSVLEFIKGDLQTTEQDLWVLQKIN